jgi:hypothetical protein
LRWKGVAPVVACRYCDTHVHTPTGQVTHEPAVVRSQPKGSGGCTIVAFILGINLLVGAIALVVALATDGPGKVMGVPMSTLVTLDLTADNATVAAALGLNPDEDGDDLFVPLRGSDFDYAYLWWDDDHPEHVGSFGLYASEGHPNFAPVITSLEASLGRRLEPEADGYRYWRWAGAHVNVTMDGSHLGVRSDPDDDSHWAYRTRLLWSVVMAAAGGAPLDVEPTTRQAWLAHGYDLDTLAAMELGYDVDGARAYMAAAFPGVHAEVFSGLDFEIPLAHPWFGQAELSWPNERGGTLATAYLRPPPGHTDWPDQGAIRRCLDGALGAGEIREQDHLAGTWAASWDLPDGSWVHLSPSLLQVRRDSHRAQPRAASWRRVFGALHACGPR